MKKLISVLSLLFVFGIGLVSAQCSCSSKAKLNLTKSNVKCNQEAEQVKAFYFHATRRCATCMAVESVTVDAIQKYYGDKVPFRSVNGEERKNIELMRKYKIGGQSLIIVKGDKIVDLTNLAFINARRNPKKLENKIKSTIDSML